MNLATGREEAAKVKLVVILREGESGYIVAQVPVLRGCISQGKTREETLRNIREAAELCLESAQEEGWVVPSEYQPGDVIELLVHDSIETIEIAP